MLFQMAVFLYTSRVLIQVLGVENYGLYDVVGGIVVVLMFLNNSMTTCTQRFITVALGRGQSAYLNEVYSVATALHCLLGVLVVVVGGILGSLYIQNFLVFPAEKVVDVYAVFGCSLLSGMLMIMSVPSNATIIAHEDMGAFAGITILDVTLKLSAALSLYLLPEQNLLLSYALLMLFVAAIVRSVYWFYCHRHYRTIRFRWVKGSALYREMLSFMGWNTFGNAAYVGNTQGINLVLNAFGGPVVNAARGVAFQVQTAVTQFIASFQTAINPQITKTYAQGQVDQTNRLILISSRLSFMLMLFIALPLLLDTDYILALWLGKVPPYASVFIRWMLCATLVDCVANPMMIGASATGRVKTYYLVIGTTLLLTLPVGYFVVRTTGNPTHIFVTLLATTILAQIFRMAICRGLFQFSVRAFLCKVVGRICLTGGLAAAASYWLFTIIAPNTIWQHAGFVFSSMALSAILVLIFGLEATERNFLAKKLHLPHP